MSGAHAAHQCFVDFVAAFYRDAGSELPCFESNADSPIAFDVQVEGVKMTVGYDPLSVDANLFVHCVFGALPKDDDAAALRWLLQRNLLQARRHGATFCLDRATQEVVCYTRRPVAGFEVATLREELTRVARQATRWRTDRLADEDPVPDAGECSDAWAVFA